MDLKIFKYVSIQNNFKCTSRIFAKNKCDAIEYLKSNNHFICDIKECKFFSKSINVDELILFFIHIKLQRQFKMHIEKSIAEFSLFCENLYFANILNQICIDLQNGYGISYAFKRHEKIFGSVIVGIVEISEHGDFYSAIDCIVDFLNFKKMFNKEFSKKLFYPLFVFVFSLVCMIFCVCFLLPQLENLVDGLNINQNIKEISPVEASSLMLIFNENFFLCFAMMCIVIAFFMRKFYISYNVKLINNRYIKNINNNNLNNNDQRINNFYIDGDSICNQHDNNMRFNKSYYDAFQDECCDNEFKRDCYNAVGNEFEMYGNNECEMSDDSIFNISQANINARYIKSNNNNIFIFLMKIPIFHRVIAHLFAWQLSNLLNICLKAKMNINIALNLISKNMLCNFFNKIVENVLKNIESGYHIPQSFLMENHNFEIIPASFLTAINIAHANSDYQTIIVNLSNYHNEIIKIYIKNFSRNIMIFSVVFSGVIFIFIILHVFYPVYDLCENIMNF